MRRNDRTFSVGTGDPGSFGSLCVTLCFLPVQIRVLISNKEGPPNRVPDLWVKPWTILKMTHWLSDAILEQQLTCSYLW